MNGISLLVALAAVGIDVNWESTPSGELVYTIRAEPLVIEQLRDGLVIESSVKKADRNLRKFRVAVGPKNSQTERLSATTANEVDYGWRPDESGGMEYFVQISLERLETLSRGIPLICEVHPNVPAVDRIFVIVGDVQLPRELPQANVAPAAPRNLSSLDNSRSGSIAPVSGTETDLSTGRYANGGYGSQGNTPVNVSDTNRASGFGTQTSQGNLSNNQSFGPATAGDYRNQASSLDNRYGQFNDNTLDVPPLNNSGPADYDRNRNLNYDYNRNQYAPQVETVARPPANYAAPLAQTAALSPPQTQQPTYDAAAAANPLMESILALQKAQLELAQSQKAAAPPTLLSAETVAKPASSKPLILTTLALFASIGANAYLGWLAWSFFWRFRDTASDLSRTRSSAFPAGSAVGH
ncbi:MAG: hypothetical protein O3C40_18375 [Planctomycetota bacterium]|nr:hypothetical protein [Planctomycetota bacterium]